VGWIEEYSVFLWDVKRKGNVPYKKIASSHRWLLATGYWLLATGYWLLATGYWLLATG
jgi:hypothetical protein